MRALAAGTRLGGFRIVRELGRGGMGVVYEARDDALGRSVAVKVLSSDRLLERFHREARAAAAVSHPNVTRVHGSGDQDGLPYVVFELVPGRSLAARVRETGPLPWREAAALGAGVARGLAAIHEAGLVHRDVKPENVLLDAEEGSRLFPGHAGLALLHVRALLRSNPDPRSALDEANRLAALPPSFEVTADDIHRVVGEALLGAGDAGRAAVELGRVTGRLDARTLVLRARARKASGDVAGARADVAAAKALDADVALPPELGDLERR